MASQREREMAGPLSRFAATAVLRSQRSALQQLPRAAAVHTVPDAQLGTAEDPEQAHPDVYAREEHKWDDSDLSGGTRASRFPATLSVPEGAARVAMPDFPSIARHSLMEPNYGSFGSSVRDPPYTYVPKRRYTVAAGARSPAPPARQPAKAVNPNAVHSAASYEREENQWSTLTPLPTVSGSWYKADW